MRRRLLYVTLALFAYTWVSVCKAETQPINQFSGLNTDDSPLTLSNGQTPDSENVITDDGPGLQGRKGFVAFATQAPVGLWEFPKSDGTRYLIVNTGTRLLADTGGGTFQTLISTVPNDRTVAASVLGDRFYFADTLNGLKYWDATSVFIASATMKVDKLCTWKGRLVAAGIVASQRVIFLSKYLDGTNWTAPVNPSDDDAAQITVAGALDENIQALFASFKDILVWFKKNSFGGIYGSRRSNFSQRTFSDYVGVSSVETIRDCDGLLRWLGNNRKVWEFDGATFNKISEDIDNIFATVSQGDSSAKSNTQTTEAQFEAGTQSPSGFADTVTTPGNLTPKTTTFFDTGLADFSAGTFDPTDSLQIYLNGSDYRLSNHSYAHTETTSADFGSGSFDMPFYADTATVSGTLETTFPEPFNTARDGTSGTKSVWTTVRGASGWSPETMSTRIISNKLSWVETSAGISDYIYTNSKLSPMTQSTTVYFDMVSFSNSSGNSIFPEFYLADSQAGSRSGIFGAATWWRLAFIGGQFSGFSNSCGLSSGSGGSFSYPATIAVNITPTNYTVSANGTLVFTGTHSCGTPGMYAYMGFQNNNFGGGTTTVSIDNFTVQPQTFTYTSPAFDTAVSRPLWGTFTATSSGLTTPTYKSLVSDDNVSYDAASTVTSGSNLGSASKRYYKIQAIFNHTAATGSASLTALQDWSTLGYTTGTFTSRTFYTGLASPLWGVLAISSTVVNPAVINTYTQSSNDGSSWDARVAATNGIQITSARKSYLRYQIELKPTSYTAGTDVSDVTLTAKSTGTWTSAALSIGSAITAWGPLGATFNNGSGNITIQFSTSTNGVTFSSWTVVPNNTIPVVSTAPFAAVRVIFDLDVATDTPNIDDITINWTEGSTVRAASAYSNQRYWLAVAIGATTNNRVLIFDKKRQWQRYNGINMDACTLYNSKLYFGNSTGIYNAENGYSDNSAAIASYYRTTTIAPNKLDLNTNFDYLYMTTDPSDSTLATSFQINGIPTDYSMGSFQMNSTTGFQNFKLPFGASEVQTGKNISFKWSVSGTSFWRISNGTLYHQPLALPE